jgi:hypothetical protein
VEVDVGLAPLNSTTGRAWHPSPAGKQLLRGEGAGYPHQRGRLRPICGAVEQGGRQTSDRASRQQRWFALLAARGGRGVVRRGCCGRRGDLI